MDWRLKWKEGELENNDNSKMKRLMRKRWRKRRRSKKGNRTIRKKRKRSAEEGRLEEDAGKGN